MCTVYTHDNHIPFLVVLQQKWNYLLRILSVAYIKNDMHCMYIHLLLVKVDEAGTYNQL